MSETTKERSIIFQDFSIRAWLANTKHMTRRVMKLKNVAHSDVKRVHLQGGYATLFGDLCGDARFLGEHVRCPYGKPRDRLWVRETHALSSACGHYNHLHGKGWLYRADGHECVDRWRPSIFMPRQASRITLDVTDVRAERVQDITPEDAVAEGVFFRDGFWCSTLHPIKGTYQCWPSARVAFEKLWDSINAKPKPCLARIDGKREITHYVSYPWEDIQETRIHRGKPWHVVGNPWVWAVSFRNAP